MDVAMWLLAGLLALFGLSGWHRNEPEEDDDASTEAKKAQRRLFAELVLVTAAIATWIGYLAHTDQLEGYFDQAGSFPYIIIGALGVLVVVLVTKYLGRAWEAKKQKFLRNLVILAVLAGLISVFIYRDKVATALGKAKEVVKEQVNSKKGTAPNTEEEPHPNPEYEATAKVAKEFGAVFTRFPFTLSYRLTIPDTERPSSNDIWKDVDVLNKWVKKTQARVNRDNAKLLRVRGFTLVCNTKNECKTVGVHFDYQEKDSVIELENVTAFRVSMSQEETVAMLIEIRTIMKTIVEARKASDHIFTVPVPPPSTPDPGRQKKKEDDKDKKGM